MLPRVTIAAGPVELRPPQEADVEALARACADPEIARFIPLIPDHYTREDAVTWVHVFAEESWRAGGADFVMADPATGEVQGVVGVKPADRFGNAEVGYWVAPWARGKGVATAAVRAISEWRFQQGAPRIDLLTDVENLGSQRVAMGAGYTREGIRRGAGMRRDGSRSDLVAFARLATDSGDAKRAFLPDFPHGELTDGVVRLTRLAPDDAADYHRVMEVPDVMASRVPPGPPDFADSLRRCRTAGMRWLSGEQAEIAIRDAATGAYAGDIQLSNIIPPLAQAMVGYSLHPDFRGRGFVTRSVNLLVSWAFEHTSILRVVAGTNPTNTPSHEVLKRAGFTMECLVKNLLPGPNGTRIDNIQWSRSR
ncbi:GNAT family N-acetyltransferase [Acrocarpospora catenulata]|uniref:GNAT family N-acetyltransferase n=1 Tax=Acrocarpospora catenulata TaxID=2836182 RepID=UPI001BDB339D|nr:GNAT family N-acetyltransferase [Acrocarpospora catenulata]